MEKSQNRKKSKKINTNNNISKMMKLMGKITTRNHKRIITSKTLNKIKNRDKNNMNKNLQKNPKGKKKYKSLK